MKEEGAWRRERSVAKREALNMVKKRGDFSVTGVNIIVPGRGPIKPVDSRQV
jgi:hypothetical protein